MKNIYSALAALFMLVLIIEIVAGVDASEKANTVMIGFFCLLMSEIKDIQEKL